MNKNPGGGKKDQDVNKLKETANSATSKKRPSKYVEVDESKRRSTMKLEGDINLLSGSSKTLPKGEDNITSSNQQGKNSPSTEGPNTQPFDISLETSTKVTDSKSSSDQNIQTSLLQNTPSVTMPVITTPTPSSTPLPSAGNINVICRFRPLNEKEKANSKEVCVEFLDSQQLSINSVSEKNNYKFAFDRIFDPTCTQQEIYDVAAKPIIDSVLEGFNGTILAYGQTSSGKTHTMQGVLENPEKEGIIPRMIRNVFNYILHAGQEIEFTVKVSMVEIYMEKIRDLIALERTNLNIREDKVKGIYIEDLSEHYVGNEEEVLDLMKMGSENRAISATDMNAQSSRSHSIFIMQIHQNNIKDLTAKTGKLYLVDLAGSEKISKTGATGMTLDEGKMINKSLTTLGMVINNLTDSKSQHVPYRDSKLTRVLQESLGGNSRTCLIITCSPSTYNEAETLSTLRFGLRAKKIKNKPKINKEVSVAELKLEIDKLEKLLVITNKRVEHLENFIKAHGMAPPSDGDLSYLDKLNREKISKKTRKRKKEKDVVEEEGEGESESESSEEEISQNKENKKDSEEDIGEDKVDTGGDKSSRDKEEDRYVDEESRIANKEFIRELTGKYAEMISQVTILEEEKNDLSEKLEDAYEKIREQTEQLEDKDKLIEELEQIKLAFHSKEVELCEKMNELHEQMEMERLEIKVNTERPRAKSYVDCPDLSITNQLANFSLESGIKKDEHKERINSTLFGNNKANLTDELYLKIQEAVLNGGGDVQLNSLFDLIKVKLNVQVQNIQIQNSNVTEYNSEKNEIVSKHKNSIEKNTDFEIAQRSPIREHSNSVSSVSSIPEEIYKRDKKKLENEKKLILKALEEKAEKIMQMEGEIKDLKERVKLVEGKMNPEDKQYIRKILSLEKSLEQVNLMYHQVVTQKSVLKIENQVLEKKINKRNEKISTIERENGDLREQVKMRDDKLSYYQKSYIKSSPNNVVKVIRGGHVKHNAILNADTIRFNHSLSEISDSQR